MGAFVMLMAIVFAWPDPATLLPTALVLSVQWSASPSGSEYPPRIYRRPSRSRRLADRFLFVRGDIGWTLDDSTPIKNALLSATSGNVLVPLAAFSARWLGTCVAFAVGRRPYGRHRSRGNGRRQPSAGRRLRLRAIRRPGGRHLDACVSQSSRRSPRSYSNDPTPPESLPALIFASLVQAIVYRFNVHGSWSTRGSLHSCLMARSSPLAVPL